jgi:hypothetical protein
MIVDYRGQLVDKQRDTNSSTFVCGASTSRRCAITANRRRSPIGSRTRAELAQIIYEKALYPKNRYLDEIPPKHAQYKRDVIDKQVELMQERRIWKKPAK